MNKFAKIIEYKDYQILLQKVWEYDQSLNESIPAIRQTTINDEEFEVNLLLGFHEESQRNDFFDNYNDEKSEEFIQEFLFSRSETRLEELKEENSCKKEDCGCGDPKCEDKSE